MIITYLSCDGETEVEEEIVSAEFYEYNYWLFEDPVSAMKCIRPDGTNFVVDCRNVYSIKA